MVLLGASARSYAGSASAHGKLKLNGVSTPALGEVPAVSTVAQDDCGAVTSMLGSSVAFAALAVLMRLTASSEDAGAVARADRRGVCRRR